MLKMEYQVFITTCGNLIKNQQITIKIEEITWKLDKSFLLNQTLFCINIKSHYSINRLQKTNKKYIFLKLSFFLSNRF